ncbi:TPA: hypothetical protein N0F65_008241 [Lagenidium giganteum]|uniref:Globin domain-containing protein n=1 Tax=Lagenidium giganteum TaxID=4803 RepID=A0AAV2Z0S9_9STRA|nr:TPA: hypothetical protein N0F65_008241 [Lagenidium giganteum]
MGRHGAEIAPDSLDASRPGKRLTRAQRRLAKKYLPSFPCHETSTADHMRIAAAHWNAVFRDSGPKQRQSQAKTDGGAEPPTRSALLFAEFYSHLETKAPQLKHVFRASMHVQSQVLDHISLGMRALLSSHSFADKVLELTKTHLRFGVQLEYFDPLGTALMHAMAQVSGHYWTPQIETAWRRLYAHCSVLLLQEHQRMTEPESGRKKNNKNGQAKRLPKEYLPFVEKYLPSFNYQFASTEEHRQIAADHWNRMMHDGATTSAAAAKAQSSARQSDNQYRESPLGRLYDVFYAYLEVNAPELKTVFRSSIQTRSKVLLHISAGMRTLLVATDMDDRVVRLTQTHRRFGVRLEHFDPLGLALIHAMKECSASFWSVEVENAWCRLFSHCSAILLHSQDKEGAGKEPKRATPSGPTAKELSKRGPPMSFIVPPAIGIAPDPSRSQERGKRFTRTQRKLLKKYLPSFQCRESSTAEHLRVAGAHWNAVFRDHGSAKSGKSSQSNNSMSRKTREQPSRTEQLFTTFYANLETKAPQIKHVFRSSQHVQSKVLEHISSGMRALLMSPNFVDKVAELTKTHLRFGVQLEYFDALGVQLLDAMKEVSGHYWTPEVSTAWRRLYGHCSLLLLEEHQRMTEPEGRGGKKNAHSGRAKRLPKDLIPLVNKYLPNFTYQFESTAEHRQIAADHWHTLFKDSNTSGKSNNSSSRNENSQQTTRIGLMYDVFYAYLEKNSPHVTHVFRSSIHVRSKVLMHISAGMRTLLLSKDMPERLAHLTKTHMTFGVKLTYFDPLGLALLHAMKEVSGKGWTVEVENAWSRLFAHCSAFLIHQQSKVMDQQGQHKSSMSPAVGDIKVAQSREGPTMDGICFGQVSGTTPKHTGPDPAVGILICCFSLPWSFEPTMGCVQSFKSDGPLKFSRQYCRIIQRFLPNFTFDVPSNDEDRMVAFLFWENVFKENLHTDPHHLEGTDTQIGRLYANFYSYLFEHSPQLKPLFQASIKIQSRVLVHISSGMKSLLQSEDLVQKVMNLALVHMKIGVKPEDFDPLGEALIQAMKMTCGDAWNERVELAWRRIYCHASIMILVNIPNTDLDMDDYQEEK